MKVAIGQDSHAFEFQNSEKPLVLAGVIVPEHKPLKGNSDADVVFHAITNAISGITTVNILGKIADNMCNSGITDSAVYLKEALKYLDDQIEHISISIECLTPKITPIIPQMRTSISNILDIPETSVGITATTGEHLTEFGKGNGIQVFVALTTK